MSFDSLAQPWAPNKTDKTQRIPKASNSSWRYMHHPTSWSLEYVQDGKKTKPIFVPKLARFVLKAGVNGIGGTNDAPQTALARTQIQDAGNTIIDPSKHDYLRVYPAVGGTLTLNKWTKPENLGGRVFMVSDDEGFRDWRKNLVRDEVIDMPNLLVLQAIMRKQQELIIMHNSKPHIPQAQKELTLAEQRYEDMQKAYEAIEKQGKKYYE